MGKYALARSNKVKIEKRTSNFVINVINFGKLCFLNSDNRDLQWVHDGTSGLIDCFFFSFFYFLSMIFSISSILIFD